MQNVSQYNNLYIHTLKQRIIYLIFQTCKTNYLYKRIVVTTHDMAQLEYIVNIAIKR